jgi:hypothetical protein
LEFKNKLLRANSLLERGSIISKRRQDRQQTREFPLKSRKLKLRKNTRRIQKVRRAKKLFGFMKNFMKIFRKQNKLRGVTPENLPA